jgi:hypothetical protein
MVVTSGGGQLIRTPCTSADDNLQIHHGNIVLDDAGTAKALLVSTVEGNERDDVRAHLLLATPEKRQQWLLDDLQLPGADLITYRLSGLEADSMRTTIGMDLSIDRYASGSAERIFFQPAMVERRTYVPPDVVRRSPVNFPYRYHDVDSLVYHFPPSYKCEAMPKEVLLSSPVGTFSSSVREIDANTLLYVRDLRVNAIALAPAYYGEYRKFFADVVKSDKSKVVLVRN